MERKIVKASDDSKHESKNIWSSNDFADYADERESIGCQFETVDLNVELYVTNLTCLKSQIDLKWSEVEWNNFVVDIKWGIFKRGNFLKVL